MKTQNKIDLAAKVWNEIYYSNFYNRDYTIQREWAEKLFKGLENAGLIEKENA